MRLRTASARWLYYTGAGAEELCAWGNFLVTLPRHAKPCINANLCWIIASPWWSTRRWKILRPWTVSARAEPERASERLTTRARCPNYCSGEPLRRERLSAAVPFGYSCVLSFCAQRFPIIINHSGIRRRFRVALNGCEMEITLFFICKENNKLNCDAVKILASKYFHISEPLKYYDDHSTEILNMLRP